MSQYPSPYSGPYSYPAYADPYAAARAPAGRAGILMIVIGVLLLCLGMCSSFTLFAPENMVKQQLEMMPVTPEGPMTVERMRTQSLVSMIVLGVMGATLIVLGAFVRRGGRGAVITGIVVSSLAIFVLGLVMLATLVVAARAPILFLSACLFAVPLGLFILLLVWLIQSLRGSATLQQMQAMYQQQYWQYQQQQQMYGQSGYGYQQPPASPRPDQSGPASNEPPAPGTS